jgi:hypothetical protein
MDSGLAPSGAPRNDTGVDAEPPGNDAALDDRV